MAVLTATATIGVSQDFSTIAAWNSSQSGNDYVTLSNLTSWPASTAVSIGDLVINDTPERVYICITAGTTAGSGGPTGTGADITDNTAHWKFLGATSGNTLVYEGLLKNEVHTQDASITLGASITMSAVGYLILKCQAGASFSDDDTNLLRYDSSQGAAVTSDVHVGIIVTLSNFARIEGVQWLLEGSTKAAFVHASDSVQTKCIVSVPGVGGDSAINTVAGGHVVNCLVYSLVNTGGDGFGWKTGGKCAFNTVVVASDDTPDGQGFQIHGVDSGKSMQNNAAYGWSNSLSKSGSGTITTTEWNNNIADDDSTGYPTGGSNVYDDTYSATDPFVQAAAHGS